MRKLLLIASTMILLALNTASVFNPDGPVFWLASGSWLYVFIRSILAIVLVLLVMTNPPRQKWFRLLSGAVAVIIAGWSFQEMYSFTMPLLDALTFLGSSIAIGISALEITTEEQKSLARDQLAISTR